MPRSSRFVSVACIVVGVMVLAGAMTPAGATRAPMLPNPRPEPPHFVIVQRPITSIDPAGVVKAPGQGEPVLKFPTVAWNVGSVALDLLGEPTLDPTTWRALQCVRWEGRLCQKRRDVGDVLYHPDHNHFHFEDFAKYELRRITATGMPSFEDQDLLASSPKVSFCLQDSVSEEGREPTSRFYASCAGVLQGISPGWADVYDYTLPGQSLPISGLADGRYALVITLDPERRLRESDETDNVAFSVVELSGNGTEAHVVPQS